MGSAADGWGGGGQRGVCVAGVAGGPSEGIKRWRTKAGEGKHSRRAGLEQRGKEGADRQSVASDFWLCLWSVRAGAAKFNWMGLELRGRTGAAVTVPPHRTGFSVPSEFSSHTPQAVDGRPDGRAQTEPIPFRVKVSKVTVVTPPDPRPPTLLV